MQSSKKTILILIVVFLVLIGAAFAYWYFMIDGGSTAPGTNTGTGTQSGFQPFNRPPTNSNTQTPSTGTVTNSTSSPTTNTPATIPTLRLLSNTPVGGYGASTTAKDTAVRWVERGRGNVYEARSTSLDIHNLSNTLVPRLYHSIWNKNLTAFISSTIGEDLKITTLYAHLLARPKSALSTTTDGTVQATSLAPFDLKGRNLPENIISYAVSPKKDKLFMLVNENGTSVGYTSTFEGGSVTRIFDTPSTQLTAEWPEDNTIVITTKGSANQGGFLYTVNPATGTWKKVLGPVAGLSAKMSKDGKYILASFSGNNTIMTSLYTVATGAVIDPAIRTLAEKCVWGTFYKHVVYCATPTEIPNATYPDDWYKSKVSFSDKIWQLNASTGEVYLVTTLSDKADRIIDAFNLTVDDRDDYLFFMNKNDLSLWSLDLISSN